MSFRNFLGVATSLAKAEAMGVKTHGLIRLKSYLDSIKDGSLTPDARPEISSHKGSVMNMDGKSGFGIYSAYVAANESMQISRETGISTVGMKNLHHVGMLEYITDMCATAGFVAIAMSNGHPAVSPPDGNTRMIGTNPLSISIPSVDGNFNLDLAISKTSFGSVRKSVLESTKLDAGLALDRNGNPTTDPLEAMNGSLVPFGGYKGFGLGLVIDLLAGLLTGSAAGTEVVTWNELGRKWNNGFLIITVNPEFFVQGGEFKSKVAAYFSKFRELAPKSSIPGQKRQAKFLASMKDGIQLDENQALILKELCKVYDLKFWE